MLGVIGHKIRVMDIPIEEELKGICKDILAENKSEQQWAEIESDDMFQTAMFCGGYDADENEFCFSYFSSDDNEYWFQISLSDVTDIASGRTVKITGHLAQ